MSKQVFTQPELKEKLLPIIRQQAILFKKHRQVFAKKAIGGEKISTVTSDGKETENTAKPGDFIVQNQTAASEQYIVPADVFPKKYVFHEKGENGSDRYGPIGQVFAVELTAAFLGRYKLLSEFRFIASWGTEMYAKKGDFLVAPPDFSEIYRIAKKEFFETYIVAE